MSLKFHFRATNTSRNNVISQGARSAGALSLNRSGDEWLINWPDRKYKRLLAGDVEMQILQEVGSDNLE
jgi:hypothetical protein